MANLPWKTVKEYDEITFKVHEGVARIAFNRPEVRNAFTPKTVDELWEALITCHESQDIGVVLITGEGPSPKDGGWAFCSGGDQNVRSNTGYKGENGVNRFNILDVQRQIRFMNKVVIAVVPGWAVGGGHSLHVVCDMTIASKEHAVFKQTDADVASFDGGFGSAYLARQVGQKRAREIFFLGASYSAQEAYEMGMVNAVVPHAKLEETAFSWAKEIMTKSPTAIKMLKFGFNLIDDGLVGQQVYAGEATRLAYGTEEAKEGRDAFLEKRPRDFSRFPKFPESGEFPSVSCVTLRRMAHFCAMTKQCLALGVWWIACGLAFAQTEEKPASESPYTLEVTHRSRPSAGLDEIPHFGETTGGRPSQFGVRHGCTSAHGSRAQRRLQQPVQRELVGIRDEPQIL